jgi:hypothetical protein
MYPPNAKFTNIQENRDGSQAIETTTNKPGSVGQQIELQSSSTSESDGEMFQPIPVGISIMLNLLLCILF